MQIEDILYPFLQTYIHAPQWMKSVVGHAYACVPLGFRRGKYYGAFAKELATHKDEVSIRRLSEQKLAATLKMAIETVPAYQNYRSLLRYLDKPGDLEALLVEIPPVSKEEIKNDVERFLSTSLPQSYRLKVSTGGSTADPMRFYLQKGVTRPKEYSFMDDFLSRVGLSPRDIILSLQGRMVPTASRKNGRFWMYEPIKRQVILSSDHLEAEYMPQYMEALRMWRPSYIQAYPSTLYPLARWLSENPQPDIVQRIKGVLIYSENVYEFQRRLIESVFNCPVLIHYGHSERVLMAASMPNDPRYFFWPQYGKFELLDTEGRQITQPGILGEIVGTSFDNQVMPFIRYRTGDFAVLGDRPHQDLPLYPVCERIEARLQEFLVCKDQRLISVSTLGAAHFDEINEIETMQYEQHLPGVVLVKVVSTKPLSPASKESIARAIREKTQNGCVVEVSMVDDLPRTLRGKHKMLVQHLDISPYMGAAAIE